MSEDEEEKRSFGIGKWLAIAAGVGVAGYALNAASKPGQIVPMPKRTMTLSQAFGGAMGAAVFSAGGTRYVAKGKLDESGVLPVAVPGTTADERAPKFVGWANAWLPQQLEAGHRIFLPVGPDGRSVSTKTALPNRMSQYAIPLFIDTVPDGTEDVYEVTL